MSPRTAVPGAGQQGAEVRGPGSPGPSDRSWGLGAHEGTVLGLSAHQNTSAQSRHRSSCSFLHGNTLCPWTAVPAVTLHQLPANAAVSLAVPSSLQSRIKGCKVCLHGHKLLLGSSPTGRGQKMVTSKPGLSAHPSFTHSPQLSSQTSKARPNSPSHRSLTSS